jgi:hypothetical protein
MSKIEYTEYQKEILEMYYAGKDAAEIAEIINARYSTDITESSVNGAIKMNKGKQNENEQNKMFSENQERVPNKENSEAKKMDESDRALLQAQIKSFSRLEKELHNTFVIFTVINREFSRAVDAIEERNRKNKSNYLLLGGLFLLFFIFSMLLGYHDAHPEEDMSIFYLELLESIGIGVFISLGLGITLRKISKRS